MFDKQIGIFAILCGSDFGKCINREPEIRKLVELFVIAKVFWLMFAETYSRLRRSVKENS